MEPQKQTARPPGEPPHDPPIATGQLFDEEPKFDPDQFKQQILNDV